MLFRKDTLAKIAAGEVTLAFRKWKRPTVKAGGTLTTRIGVLDILEVEKTRLDEITDPELQRADIRRETLKKIVDEREGDLYRIAFTVKGEDPRISLRSQNILTPGEVAMLVSKLEGYDKRSKSGPWAYRILELIEKHPGTVSTELAAMMDVERYWLKGNIRKLKNLGLTISLDVGYALSPRGEAFRKAMGDHSDSA